MKIKKVSIERYGPLSSRSFEFCDGINLIYGPNGSGKSLIIESIFKFLTGRSSNFVSDYDRIQEYPEGYIIVQKGEKEIKLERGQTIHDVYNLNLSEKEIKNLFFIKDCNYNIEDETGFYESLTDKILGIKTQDLEQIRKEIQYKGRITPNYNLTDSITHEKPKSQLNKAKKLLQEIENYINKAKENKVYEYESKKLELKIEKENLRTELEIIKDAKKVDDFNKLKTKANEIQKIISKMEQLPQKEKIDNLISLSKELEKNKKNKPLEYLTKNLEYLKVNGIISAIVFAILLIITTVISIIKSSFFIFGMSSLAVIFLICLLISVNYRSVNKQIAEMSMKEKEINELMKTTFNRDFKTTTEILQVLNETNNERDELRDKFMKTIASFEEEFNLKNLKPDEKSLNLIVKHLEEYKKSINFDIPIQYSETNHRRIEERLEEIENEENEILNKHEEHKEKLLSFERDLREIKFDKFIDEKVEPRITHIESLEKMIPLLNKIIAEITTKAEIAKSASKILEIMIEEENRKKEEIFKDNEFLKNVINQITKAHLLNIEFNSEEDTIIVEKSNGSILNIKQLSYGEWTQVYFTIKVALANKYLNEKQSFFIFENPFISSDDERLDLQLEFINNLAQLGWQIILLSSKSEIVKKFEQLENKGMLYEIGRL